MAQGKHLEQQVSTRRQRQLDRSNGRDDLRHRAIMAIYHARINDFGRMRYWRRTGGAIFWGGLGRVVFALSERAFYQLVGPDCDGLRVGCRDVFAHGQRPIEVHGPALEDEALAVHLGFWGQRT